MMETGMDENTHETRMRGWRLPPALQPQPQGQAQPEQPGASAAWLDRPARGGDVRGCYRYIFGREPENEEVVARHLVNSPTIGALRRRFMASDEFRAQLGGAEPSPSDAVPVAEIAASAEQLDKLLLWQLRCWSQLGQQAPHYSVLPDARFLPESFEANRAAFYATGAADAALVVEALARHGLGPERLARLCEFGCGVGRVSLHLAGSFPDLTCIDISAPHLAAAREQAAAWGMTHIAWQRAKPGQPMPAGGYDLWLSQRTLQWNPPPLILAVLRQAFAGLAPGGVAMFELPVWRGGYRFELAEYLGRPAPAQPAGHLLPMAALFGLLAESGMQLLEVSDMPPMAGHPDPCRAPLFLLRKAGLGRGFFCTAPTLALPRDSGGG